MIETIEAIYTDVVSERMSRRSRRIDADWDN
jgi:hypothetical protein